MSAPAPAVSLVDTAYEWIRRRILDNVWPPGHRALEQEVALELGMSRTPVREALVRLQNDGLVEVVPRHGMRVLPVSPQDWSSRPSRDSTRTLPAFTSGMTRRPWASMSKPPGREMV